MAPSRPRATSAALALLAAFGWSTYYVFVLWATPGARPSAVIVYPFLFGGAAYALWAAATGAGRAFLQEWREPSAYLRTALLLGMQFSVLAATYLTGPVDASLLSLIGDVVATPVIVAFVFATQREHVTTARFGAGLLLSLVGGSLAIAGGHSLSAIPLAGWLVVPAVPLTVAFYFVLSARANASRPLHAVVAQSMLAAGVLGVVIAPLIPGGWAGLGDVAAVPMLLLLVTGLSSFFVAPLLYFVAIQRGGMILPPMLMTGIPVFTMILSAAFLGIAPAEIAILGVPVAVVGAVLALGGEHAHPSATAPAADR